MNVEKFKYDNVIVRNFAIATIVWGLVGMLVGVIIALQLPIPALNQGEYLSFGRLRPLHTNAVIFAFVGNGVFLGVYYSLQRLCKTRMFSDALSKLHFWGWQLIIVLAAITLPLGINASKEYAELEWPIDILITIVWVIFGINMFGTILKRREKHLYVAIWFYIATFIAVAVLHIFNSLAVPVSWTKSYSVYAGVQDALVQWWYGHNAVAFFLTTPYLGLMYYFLPKAANRPVFSYRLSIIHFWSLVFIYIWAGPHHLLYSAVPNWAQALGVVFSVTLIAPSWGGMLNGLLTLRGAWDTVREKVELKFMVVAVTCYGMATLEGPLMALKNVNAMTHFSDWTIGHVHNAALGWNGFLTFGVLYWIVPKIYNTNLYSRKLANIHFWIGTLGIVFYVIAMYFSGVTQSLMWKEMTAEGTLKYPNFMSTVLQIIPMYYLRAIGGALFLIGALIMAFNLFKTAQQGNLTREEEASAPELIEDHNESKGHKWLEGRAIPFFLFTAIAVVIGGIVELTPSVLGEMIKPTKALVKPYTALELEGRDLYVREGCSNCHSQMIRPFVNEVKRYGEPSEAGDYVYEHPFLWGSKRTGPDLQRIGGKYNNAWHYSHLRNPVDTSVDSIMPKYPWLFEKKLSFELTERKMKAFKLLGVPYLEEEIQNCKTSAKAQAEAIIADLKKSATENNQYSAAWDDEIIAMIAYLQAIGKRVETTDDTKVEVKP